MVDWYLVVCLSCLTEWVYLRYFFNQPIRSKEQLWWQQFLWIFDLTFFYKTYVLLIALTANLIDFRSRLDIASPVINWLSATPDIALALLFVSKPS